MRTTIDINEQLIRDVMKVSRTKSKKEAITVALETYLKEKRRQELKNMIGQYPTFDLTLEQLELMRRDD